ncbi:hypothetical protein B6E66_15635 [Streptomyces maremycinicus]|nr:hypothetical protein B6E66_15635 [Streptomyces sp. B9173]
MCRGGGRRGPARPGRSAHVPGGVLSWGGGKEAGGSPRGRAVSAGGVRLWAVGGPGRGGGG